MKIPNNKSSQNNADKKNNDVKKLFFHFIETGWFPFMEITGISRFTCMNMTT